MIIMPEAARSELIERALEAEDAKRDAERRFIPWKEGKEKCTAIELELDAVVLNPRSHRIRAQLDGHSQQARVLSEPESLDAQNVISELLRRTEGYGDIKSSLQDEGQREPGVVTRKGILVNGNTRAVALRELGTPYIRVLVLPKNATPQQISELELRLQVRRDFKQEYTFTNQLLFVRECLEEARWTYNRVARELDYSTRLGEKKGIERVHQDQRVLAMINELREMSSRRYSYTFFDDSKQALEEIDQDFEQLNKSDPAAALRLRNARMIGVLCGLGYRELRHVGDDFIPRYLEPEIHDDEDLAVYETVMLRAHGGHEPAGLDLLGGQSEQRDPGARMLEWLAETAGNSTVSVDIEGKRFSRPRDEVVEAIRGACEGGVTAAKEDKKREDLIDQPRKRLQEARQKLRAASEALKLAIRDKRFDASRLARLRYFLNKVSKQVDQLSSDVSGEIERRKG